MNIRTFLPFLATLFIAGTLGCGSQETAENAENTETAPAFCEEHQIAEAQCPFCDPSLIEAKGQCIGHGVPEALCTICDPAVIAGFKATGDWCGGHNIPESQCTICNH